MNPSLIQNSVRHLSWRRFCLFALLVVLLTLPATGANAAAPVVINVNLTGEIPDFSGVMSFEVNPGATQVVFLADLVLDEMFELYSMPLRGGEQIKLSIPLINGGTVKQNFSISPNGDLVVYRASDSNIHPVELYSVPISGGASTKLNQYLGGDQIVSDFSISADSQWVVYRVESYPGTPQSFHDLYVVPINRSSAPIKLNDNLDVGGTVYSYQITPNSQRIVFNVTHASAEPHELYSVSVNGASRIMLNAPVTGDNGAYGFKITPDSSRVVYQFKKDAATGSELYRTGIADTGGGDRISQSFTAAQSTQGYFQISPDSSFVVYRADYPTPEKYELYSVPTSGGTIRKMNGTLSPVGGNVTETFEITPNSQYVVFLADSAVDESFNIFSHALNVTGAPQQLNPVLDANEKVTNFRITPNSAGVVYKSNHQSADQYQLYSNYIASPRPAPYLLTNHTSGTTINNVFHITPNSLGVLYSASLTPGKFELFGVLTVPPASGNTSVRWSAPMQIPEGDADIGSVVILPNSSSMLYLTDPTVDERVDLYYAYSGYQVFLPMAVKYP